MLLKIKLMLGIEGNEKDNLLQVLIDMAVQYFLDYCNRNEIPEGANAVIMQIAIIEYNRLGTKGIASQSYSGVSESYLADYPEEIKKQLNRYRKLKTI